MISLLYDIVFFTVLLGSVSASSDHGGIGVRINSLTHTIIKVYSNTPAARVGLVPGDKIIWVVDEQYKHEITGMAGTLVQLTVKRGSDTLTFDIERASEKTIIRK